jgi:hypothetical protein
MAVWISGVPAAGAAEGQGSGPKVLNAHHETSIRSLGKKGVGLAEKRGLGDTQLEELHAGWYYNWGIDSKLKTDAQFVPMVFSPKRAASATKSVGNYVLGFNEPDHPKQANASVQEALAAWPNVVALASHVGSPAMAGNPVTGKWFPEFMKAKPKVSFVAVHWYKGDNAKGFINDIEKVHAMYRLPIWVTEFAVQTHARSEAEPQKYSQSKVDKFIAETVHWMEATDFVQRYAWHDSRVGTSALFDEKGGLTATGRAYSIVH